MANVFRWFPVEIHGKELFSIQNVHMEQKKKNSIRLGNESNVNKHTVKYSQHTVHRHGTSVT